MKKCYLCIKLCTIFVVVVNAGSMDKSKLIVSDEYQNAHGCKVVTSNDDSNILMMKFVKLWMYWWKEIICMMFKTMDKNCMKVKQHKMLRGTNLKLYLLLH